jgi:hypothetical protein
MSSEMVTARRTWLVLLAGGALAAGSAAPSAAKVPDQVIDAGTNAQAASDALNKGCADMANCEWEGSVPTTSWGPQRIVGDVLYNCSTDENQKAETAIGVSDERGESTSVSESVSLEVSLGFLDLEKASLDFSLFSKQSQSFSTEVKVTSAVEVPAMMKGWTNTQMQSGTVDGSAYITQGIKLIQVKNIDMQFPGYLGPDAKDRTQVRYINRQEPITAQENIDICGSVKTRSASAARAATAQAATAQARPAALRKRYKIIVCSSKRSTARSSQRGQRRCTKRAVTGMRGSRIRQATATLTRFGRVYAAETNRRGAIRLTQRRTITPGRYKLIIRAKPRKMIVRDENGKRLHRAEQHMITIVPMTIRWTRRK